MNGNLYLDSISIEKYNKNNWPNRKNMILEKLKPLAKQEVFRPVICTLEDVKLIGYNDYLYENIIIKMML